MSSDYKTSFGTFSKDPEKSLITLEISRNIPDGVYVFTETVIFGHTFVLTSVSKKYVAYTYGRYGDPNSDYSQGVLLRYEDDACKEYLMKELYRFNSNVYKILDIEVVKVKDYFDKLWNSSNIIPKSNIPDIEKVGKVIDEYKLLSRNCTTISIDALQKSGTKVFNDKELVERCKYISLDNQAIYSYQLESLDCLFPEKDRYFIDPEILEEYLELKSKQKNYPVKKYSEEMRAFILNTKGYKYEPIKEVYRSMIGSS